MTAASIGELPASVATSHTDTQIVLPDKLSSIKKAETFSTLKLQRNSSEEVLSILISFDKHQSWLSQKVPTRPPNGSMLLFDRQSIKDYRKDGYSWKKRTSSGSSIREDHCKLKVSGVHCLNVVYTHSAIVPTFHRRIYWLLQNPDIVLVHYLNLIDDIKEKHVYFFDKQKTNILCQINSIFSGVEQRLIPKFEITENAEEESSSQSGSNTSKASQNDKKHFRFTITPNNEDDLPSITNVIGQHINSPYQVNLWMRNNDIAKTIVTSTLSQQLPSSIIHTSNVPSNNHHGNDILPSNGFHKSNIPGNIQRGTNILPSNSYHGNTIHNNNLHGNSYHGSSLQSNAVQLQTLSNLSTSNKTLQSISNTQAIQSTVLLSPICNVQALTNQSHPSPVKSNGLITQGIDLPTSMVRFPATVTSTLNVPIGYLQSTPVTEQHNVPSTSSQRVPSSSNVVGHPQAVYANSVSVETQPLLFFSSQSVPAAARVASTLNVPTSNDIVEYSIANTATLNESSTATTTSTTTNITVLDVSNNRTTPEDCQFRPVKSTQKNISQGLNEACINSPLRSVESPLANVSQGQIDGGALNGTFKSYTNATLTSSSVVSKDVILTSGAHWHDNRPPNQQLASVELSSSPSSDYGSLMSESGTRFSGSESMSSELGSNSCENGFDGPFRLPLPVTQNSRAVTQFRPNDVLSGSHHTSLPVCETDGYHRVTSTPLDSSNVDMSFDFAELHSLDELDCEGLNFDLNSVLGDYFNSPEPVAMASKELMTSSSKISTTETATGLHDTLCSAKENQNGMDLRRETEKGTTTQTHTPHENQTPTSTMLMIPEDNTPCRTPVNDIVMTTTSPHCQSYHSDDESISNHGDTHVSSNQSSIQEVNCTQEKHSGPELTCAPEMNSAPEVSSAPEVNNDNSSLLPAVMPGSACITDFSPEWSYPEGGVKVLVTGEWSSTDMSYTCLFDGCSVEASLVQMGVLRCYCPPHEPGLVTLQVASNGFIVSNACVFEYRAHDSPGDLNTNHEWLAMDDARFKLALLDRLERLESRLSVLPSGVTRTHSEIRHQQCRTFEERILVTCRALFEAKSTSGTTNLKRPYRGMTLVHLAAALGFSKLLREIALKWQDPQTSQLLRQELDPSRKDEFNCTPLMWSCALGQRAAVIELLCCHANSLLVPDACGRLPLQLARDRGYFEIVDCIEEFMMASPERRSAFNLCSSDEDEEELLESNVPSPHQTTSSPGIGHYNSPSLPPHSQNMSIETSYTDRACSPMHVEEINNGSVLLNQALVQIHEMINEAERQADLESSNLSGRLTMQLSPVQEENDVLPSSGGWGSSGSRFRTFSSASSQSSPLTPSSKSSLSPGSPAFLNSPHSSPGAPPDTKEFHEFLCSSKKLLEKNFSELTLTDREQQELYQAALIIQEAYRSYKIRRQQHDQEMQAAVLIQNHYRRYKQFLLYKKRTHAALIIQNQYRAYREHEQFKKSRRAAAIIQNQFRIYRLRRQSQKRRDEHKSKQQEARFIRQSSNRSNTSV